MRPSHGAVLHTFLTPEQIDAVTSTKSRVIINGPPGSGKTTCIVKRIEHLIADRGVLHCRRSRYVGYFLVDQLNQAALSFATNLAEGNGRFTKADRRNFFIVARGSVRECVPLLEVAQRRKLLSEDKVQDLFARLEEISRMVSGRIGGLEKRAGEQRV